MFNNNINLLNSEKIVNLQENFLKILLLKKQLDTYIKEKENLKLTELQTKLFLIVDKNKDQEDFFFGTNFRVMAKQLNYFTKRSLELDSIMIEFEKARARSFYSLILISKDLKKVNE